MCALAMGVPGLVALSARRGYVTRLLTLCQHSMTLLRSVYMLFSHAFTRFVASWTYSDGHGGGIKTCCRIDLRRCRLAAEVSRSSS
jgi:hypothetical protein